MVNRAAIIKLIRMHRTSIQPALSRVRPPRVRILPSLGDAKDPNAVELPFHIAVIAPLSDNPEGVPYRERRFIEIDVDNFDSVLRGMAPQLRIRVENKLTDDANESTLGIALEFRQLDDFGPHAIAQQVPPLRALLELRTRLGQLCRMIYRNDKAEELLQYAAGNLNGDIDLQALALQIAQEGRLARTPEEAELAKDLIAGFLEEMRGGEMILGRDVEMSMRSRIAQIDQLLSIQINEIIHHVSFQEVEATWRGLAHLVREAETSATHRIFVLNARRKEILHDIHRAADFRDIDLYAKLCEPLETLGGAPFGCIVAAYFFSQQAEDSELLDVLARMGSLLYAPVLAAPSTDWFAAPDARNMLMKFRDVHPRWQSLRRKEQSRFLVLVHPRMLLRLPYGQGAAPVEEFNFEEAVDGRDASRYLWGSPAWALAARISAAWTSYGWCAAIQSQEGGGMVQGLPVHRFYSDEGDVRSHPTTEFVVTEKMESEFFELGFCSLCQYSQRAEAVFPRVPTCKRPGGFLEAEANWNDRFGAQLPFVLACCRFALAVRMIVRDNRGLFTQPEQCEQILNQWLTQYVLLDESAAVTAKAAFPLREAKIVVDRAGYGDHWVAALFIRPHFQLDGLTAPLRVLIDLPVT